MTTTITPATQPELSEILEALEAVGTPDTQPEPAPQPDTPARTPGKFTTNLATVQRMQEDYEWYPTTDEILERFGQCVRSAIGERWHHHSNRDFSKFLDIGAGDGKVIEFAAGLKSVRHEGQKLFTSFYAIEKSQTHLNNLRASTYIMGVDFHKVTLLDKSTGVVFSNPPYSEYAEWTRKIVKETPSGSLIYLVIPERWEKNASIQAELKARGLTAEIQGRFDFQHAEDRTARAKVHLLEIKVRQFSKRYQCDTDTPDPFTQFFNENFSYPKAKEKETRNFDEEVEQAKIVHKQNLIEALCTLYEARMQELQNNYSAICSLDLEILEEFQISKNSLIESLKMKLENCKKQFWQRLFDGMSKINDRLTSSSRKTILEKMQAHTGIEFNRENCYAIVMWVIKNANSYFDSQLIETYEELVDYANVENYTSNKRVFKRDQFTYWGKRDYPDSTSHYRIKVGHRIVLHHSGGICVSYGTNRGLDGRACNLVNDLLTIANNLGFKPHTWGPSSSSYKNDWQDSDARIFRCTYKGKSKVLFRVRAFLNGNLHFQFLPEFIHALNIQHGKLKGWIHTRHEAEREVGAPTEMAAEFIDYRFQIKSGQLLLQ